MPLLSAGRKEELSESTSSSSPSSPSLIDIIRLSDPEENSFECFGIPLTAHSPSTIRKTFLRLSLKVHPDKNPDHPRAKEAFQTLSAAFELLYDSDTQRQHLSVILFEKQQQQQQQQQHAKAADDGKQRQQQQQQQQQQQDVETRTTTKKRPRSNQNWKEAKKKKKRSTPVWAERRWEDVVAEMRRREDLEKQFIRTKSDTRLEKRVMGMIWKAMKICRALDERAGCPPTFVNGLWAPLYEQEVLQTHKILPGGWELCWNRTIEPPKRIYRFVETGSEQEAHPNPEVEPLLEKARKALGTNKFIFHTEPRLFLGEIIAYLRDDHDYFDMDDDLLELDQEEKARDNTVNSVAKEYDF